MPEFDRIESVAHSLNSSAAQAVGEVLRSIEMLGVPIDLFESLLDQLLTHASIVSGDTVPILRELARFLSASRSPQSWLALFEREPEALETLLRLVATSQYMADQLVADPEAFELLRLTAGHPVSREVLEDEIATAVSSNNDLRSAMRLLRDYQHRETLRIAFGDFIIGYPLDVVSEQLTVLAESLVSVALNVAQASLSQGQTVPKHRDGSEVRFSVLAVGKLGGRELSYTSDLDLVFLYESADSSPPGQAVDEYFQRLGQLIVRLLSESTPQGITYRVDLRLRPHGNHGSLVTGTRYALDYYDSKGRTWERQAFLKARPIAGDRQLGEAFINELEPWVYRRYLMRADISGIVALKRRIEHHSQLANEDHRNLQAGPGGIRDIEYVIQFLQLLHGGEVPSVRCTGTLDAILQLQFAGCLNPEEQLALENNYRYLRRIENCLQIMVDRHAHVLPCGHPELQRIAVHLGYEDGVCSAAEQLEDSLSQCQQQNRRILDHLLKGAFDGDDRGSKESDLLLDPEPSQDRIEATLTPYGFEDTAAAYRNLQSMAVESIRFLSTRRCRHFLAAIAPQLLQEVSQVSNPDATLTSLANVSDSLGGKAVLWELFSANPPSMHLCVRLCSSSPYLAGLLTSNPGMIDELLDSLMLAKLPDRESMAKELFELCRNATDIAPILHNFKNSSHLRIGVRDILGRDSIVQTHAALSDVAEVCMEVIVHHEFHRLVHQLGMPTCQSELAADQSAEFVVLSVGKLGGREPNYHSDLDVLFLFDGEGMTRSLVPNRRFAPTTNRHFFNQLSQRVIQSVTRLGNSGRLYDLDVSLRPLGRSGELAITIEDLERYFASDMARIWERQSLCKARPIWGSSTTQELAMECIRRIIGMGAGQAEYAELIYQHRLQLQQDASDENLKRGSGGTMDVEFIVQMLQLAHAARIPQVLVPGTHEALFRLASHQCIDPDLASRLQTHYAFLRRVESGIRLMNLNARHELPSAPEKLVQLAELLSSEEANRLHWTADQLVQQCNEVRRECREIFEKVFSEWRPSAVSRQSEK